MLGIGEPPTDLSSILRSLRPEKQYLLCRTLLQELFRTVTDFEAFLLDYGHAELSRRFGHMECRELENALLAKLGPQRLMEQLSDYRSTEVLRFARSFWSQMPSRHPASAIRPPLLGISLNMDAMLRASSLWEEGPEPAELFHLDLRKFAQNRRAEPAELVAARDEASRQIYQQHIAAHTGPLDVIGKAQLPLLLWIGWQLRYVRNVTAWSDHGAEPTPFPGPQAPIVATPGRVYERLRVEELSAPLPSRNKSRLRPQEACVILDTSSCSRSEQLNQFYRSDDSPPLICARRYRLVRPTAEPIQPADLIPVLTDVLQFLSELRQQGIARIHLGLACRAVVAFFLGQRLNSQVISLYEYYAGSQDRYRYVFDLE